MWNTFLAVCGIYLKSNWAAVMKYSKFADAAVLLVLLLLVVYLIRKHNLKRHA